MRILHSLSCSLFLLALLAGCSRPEPAAIRLGAYLCLTGSQAAAGKSARDGMQLAVGQANGKGGVRRSRLELIVKDDRGEPQRAQDAVAELISKDRVVAVLGEMVNSRSLAGAAVCQQNGIPMISPASTDPRLTRVGEYVFRACYADPLQGRLLAGFAASRLGLPKIAVFRDVENDYSRQISENFQATYVRSGGRTAPDQKYHEGDSDFKPQIKAARAASCAAVLIPGYHTDVAVIARQARNQGCKCVLLGPDSWDVPDLLTSAGDALEDSYYLTHFSVDDPSSRWFVNLFKQQYGRTPDTAAALAYDAAAMLIDAVGRASAATPAAIRDALAGVRNFRGATGSISLDPNRDAVKSAVIMRVSNGQPTFFSRVNGR